MNIFKSVDQNNKPTLTSSLIKEGKTYVIKTGLHFYGLKSKLYCNGAFIKDLQKRNLKEYPKELINTLHNNAIKQLLTKY